MPYHTFSDHVTDPTERLARRRADAKLGWLIHAIVYVMVNTLLVTLSLSSGRNWAVFPLLGWGLGLAAHGADTTRAQLAKIAAHLFFPACAP